MNRRIKKRWVRRLNTTPETLHGYSMLKSSRTGAMCPLGVLVEMAVEEGVLLPGKVDVERIVYGPTKESNYLPRAVREWAGIKDYNPTIVTTAGKETVARANDRKRFSLKQIAEFIKNSL